MKTKITFSVLLVLTVVVFFFTKPEANEHNVTNVTSFMNIDTFRIGAHWTGYTNSNYDSLKEMNLNLWQFTGGINDGWVRAGVGNDYRDSSYNAYGENVKQKIDLNMSAGGMKTIMDRSKINYLGNGKRSDYECEENNINANYWFYAYRDHNPNVSTDTLDNSQFGSNSTYVRYSQKNRHDTGYVVKRLISNREQTSFRPGVNLKWYIMPRIRINPEDTTTNKLVCRIDILRYDSTLIKSVSINTANFKDAAHPYNGRYLETFYELSELLEIDSTGVFNPDHEAYTNDACGVDFRVWWAGECDMWLDRIRVENEIAYDLFGDNPDPRNYNKYQNWLVWEAQDIAGNKPGKVHYFAADEPEFDMLPSLSYLNKKIIQLSGGASSLVPVLSHLNFKAHLPNCLYTDFTTEQLKTYLIDTAGFQMFSFDCYPLFGWNGYAYLPNTLPYVTDYNVMNGQLGQPIPPNLYENWLQTYFDDTTLFYGGERFIKSIKYGYELYKQYNIPFSVTLQTHLNYAGDGQLREPTNEEIAMMTNVAVSYGAKEIMYFVYGSYGVLPVPGTEVPNYCRGIAEWKSGLMSKRTENVYRQNKWEAVKAVTTKLKKWGPTLISFDNTNTKSYIYCKQEERESLYNNSYFTQFVTFKPGSGMISCTDNFVPENIPENFIPDCQYETYLQIATFENNDANTKYFMVINRRCSPYKDSTSEDNRGGRRKVRASMHPNYSAFFAFNNWSIFNCENDSLIAKFDGSNPGYIYLDWFMPGEGRLYKIVPTMVTGGTLVCNEEIGNVTFECKGNINSNGYNIKINSGASISFHQGIEINMQGGNFICGDTNTGQYNITLSGKNGAFWNGLNLRKCPQVRIYGTRIDNAQNISPDTSLYSINLINCTDVIIQNSNITSYGVGAISSYIDSLSSDTTINYFSGNVFELEEFSGNTIRFVESGYITVPVRIEYCTFNSGNNYVGNIAIFLSGVSAGSLKYNQIEDYNTGVTILNSSVDLLSNTMSSSGAGTILVNILSGSNAILGYFDSEVLGGYNDLNSSSDTSFNIMVDNSTFYADEGHNNFRIKDKDTLSYHFYGNISLEGDDNTIYATNNCFYMGDNIDTNVCLERTDNQDAITAITYPMAGECSALFSSQMEVFQSDGGINDTIYLVPGGGGGSINEKLSITNYKLKSTGKNNYPVTKDGKVSYKYGPEDLFTLKSLYSDLCVQTRKRNYDSIIIKATQLINQYPDSLQSLDAISKLYFASLRKDSAGSKVSPLKTYFETLILNNPNNTSLTTKSFYYIQKCKVALKQYQSALTGFQQIINSNPYSYEALLASWDYAATTLLMNGGGSGGEKNVEQSEIPMSQRIGKELKDGENLENLEFGINNFTNNYDSTKFTKTDRVKIFDNTKKSFEDRKKKEKKAIEVLQNRSEKGDRRAQRELHIRKTISEVARPVSPKSINEHIKVINTGINKIFTNPNLSDDIRKTKNNIPTKYELFQNYPNPFNPVTKISFDLPKDSKVKLIVYDILGREIIRLINNEFKPAGKHIIEFNGVNLNLASGVYFYRIETDKFIAVKKMVLIK